MTNKGTDERRIEQSSFEVERQTKMDTKKQREKTRKVSRITDKEEMEVE